jgi:hypothetical protein
LSGGWNLSDKIAVIAIVVGFLQFIVLLLTVFVMSQTAKRQLRAYVCNDRANLVDFDQIPTVQIIIKNSGQTPAYSVVGWNAVCPAGVPLNRTLEKPDHADISRCHLGPGQTFHFRTRLDEFSHNLRMEIAQGTTALYAFGQVDYVDAFGKPRWLRWRMVFGQPSTRDPQGTLAVHPDGNEAN